jgi:hypothetical protein
MRLLAYTPTAAKRRVALVPKQKRVKINNFFFRVGTIHFLLRKIIPFK